MHGLNASTDAFALERGSYNHVAKHSGGIGTHSSSLLVSAMFSSQILGIPFPDAPLLGDTSSW